MSSLANRYPFSHHFILTSSKHFEQTKTIPSPAKDAAGLIGMEGQEGASQDERTGDAEVRDAHVIRMDNFQYSHFLFLHY